MHNKDWLRAQILHNASIWVIWHCIWEPQGSQTFDPFRTAFGGWWQRLRLSFVWFICVTETTVPGKPTSLRLRPLTTSIVVSWTPPVEQDIMIRGYVLGYGIGIPDIYRQIVPSRQRYYAVKSLRETIQITACLYLHRESKKGRQYTLVHIFAKYWPIFDSVSA